MGQRGELLTFRKFAEEGGLTYFFNVKENRYGDLFVNLVESRKKGESFQRYSLVVYGEDFEPFSALLKEGLIRLQNSQDGWQQELPTGSGRRVYGFSLKSTKRGEVYLVISESRVDSDESCKRTSIRVSRENATLFREGYAKVESYLGT